MSRLTVVSFYTRTGQYAAHAERLRAECDALGIPHLIEEREPSGTWLGNCRIKPVFMLDALRKLRSPILWVDVDGSILRAPGEGIDYGMDFMGCAKRAARFWFVTTLFVNWTPGGERFLERWVEHLEDTISDELALDRMWKRRAWRGKWGELPPTYAAIEGRKHAENPIVMHRVSHSHLYRKPARSRFAVPVREEKPVSVIVPFRPDSEERRKAWEYVQRRLMAERPKWQIVRASDGRGSWKKGRAIMKALKRATGEVLVITDADVWCDGLSVAVDAVQRRSAWAVPHDRVFRFTPDATRSILEGEPPRHNLPTIERPYTGLAGGGLVVMRRSVLEQTPPDPRFEGWGGEDSSWGIALSTLYGKPWRGRAPLWHLWHPPQERRSRSNGSPENDALWKRYKAARHKPDKMRALLTEALNSV